MQQSFDHAMKNTWIYRGWLLCLVLALAIGGFLAFSIWSKLDDIETARQDQRGWAYSQLEVEYLKLMSELNRVEYGENQDYEQLRTRFDVFYSRVKLANAMHLNAADDVSGLADLLSTLDRFIPVIDGSDTDLRDAMENLSDSLHRMSNVPRDVAIASIKIHAERSEAQRAQVSFYIKTLIYVLGLIAFFLISAIYFLSQRTKSLRLATQKATENEARLETMLRSAIDAVLLVDDHGRVVDLNGSAEKVFAKPRRELLGVSLPDILVSHRLREQFRFYLQNFRETGVTSIADKGVLEYEMVDGEGREFPVEIAASLVPNGDRNLFVAYIRDITERKEREAEILQMRDEALSAYREKSRFFAMMSHEMRTPLNGIIAALELLDSGDLNADQQKYLKAAMASGDILMGHINDVLAIEKAETEEGITLEPVDLAAMTATMIGAMQPFADSANVHLHLDQSGLDDRSVLTDPRALQQIMANLLSNAIKFSPGGDVTLSAHYEKVDAAANEPDMQLILEVSDTGTGIAKDDINRIFEDFVSLDSRYERRTGGTGLGLGIVKRQVKRLHGEITCESELGQGTVFHVSLPMHQTKTDYADDFTPQPAEMHQVPLHLLVVDDNVLNRDLLKAMLEKMGHSVVIGQNGQEAVALSEEEAFDAILMDISMPGINGIQATRMIRASGGINRKTPIIAATAHAMPEERAEFKAAGMEGFVEKPIRRAILSDVLAQYAAPRQDISSSEDTEPQTNDTASEADIILDTDQIGEICDILGLEKTRERVEKFLVQASEQIDDMAKAEDLADLRALAHALAGSSGMIGAAKLSRLCRNLQIACDALDDEGARHLVDALPDAHAELAPTFDDFFRTGPSNYT
ncbi:ATP-binding protein [Celeribacter sp.]|uniref:hybrid sensor histidine kinase/response regulator n=1 Tax=Celeribacter sp. TaxID=1890673 RepID=UPI003A8EE84A